MYEALRFQFWPIACPCAPNDGRSMLRYGLSSFLKLEPSQLGWSRGGGYRHEYHASALGTSGFLRLQHVVGVGAVDHEPRLNGSGRGRRHAEGPARPPPPPPPRRARRNVHEGLRRLNSAGGTPAGARRGCSSPTSDRLLDDAFPQFRCNMIRPAGGLLQRLLQLLVWRPPPRCRRVDRQGRRGGDAVGSASDPSVGPPSVGWARSEVHTLNPRSCWLRKLPMRAWVELHGQASLCVLAPAAA